MINEKKSALCRDANPRWLEWLTCSGWHHTMGQFSPTIGSLHVLTLWPCALDHWPLEPKISRLWHSVEKYSVPTFKSFRSEIFVYHQCRLGLAIVPLCHGTGAPLQRTQAPPGPFEFFYYNMVTISVTVSIIGNYLIIGIINGNITLPVITSNGKW